jgi:hypothetical protein
MEQRHGEEFEEDVSTGIEGAVTRGRVDDDGVVGPVTLAAV